MASDGLKPYTSIIYSHGPIPLIYGVTFFTAIGSLLMHNNTQGKHHHKLCGWIGLALPINTAQTMHHHQWRQWLVQLTYKISTILVVIPSSPL
jgi:surface polysaccharide O-acyltransferase-like enzyme